MTPESNLKLIKSRLSDVVLDNIGPMLDEHMQATISNLKMLYRSKAGSDEVMLKLAELVAIEDFKLKLTRESKVAHRADQEILNGH